MNVEDSRVSRPRAWWPITPGSAPGLLQIDPEAPKPQISVLAYRPESFVDAKLASVAEIKDYLDEWPAVWVNVDGLGDADVLEELGELFGIHRLALEDIVNVGQRPKAEPYQDELYVVLRAPSDATRRGVEQLSLFLGKNFLVTFQESSGDCFDGIRARLRQQETLVRSHPPDFLLYALIDAVIDAYFPKVESLRDRLESIESRILESPDRGSVARLLATKRRVLDLRRAVWPLRDCVSKLQRDAADYVSETTSMYLRDCLDHSLRLVELIELQREHVGDLMSTYMSVVSNRMNEVMKVLTIIATIFIPLSFIAGLYGMNFNSDISRWNMPELNWVGGYPFALSLMAAVAAGMLIYFKRKNWL